MCYCDAAARWWRPHANPEHADVYCGQRAGGHRVLALPEQGPRMVFHDGRELRGMPVFDGTAYVPTPESLLGRAE
jgi:hypothetical protein